MAAVIVIGLVMLAFFLAGGMVGAVALIALAHWSARRLATRRGRPGRRAKDIWR